MTTLTPAVDTDRRAWLTGRPRATNAQAFPDPVAGERASRLSLLRRSVPNTALITEDGKPVRFYDDVMKSKIVVFSAMYSACEKNCPPAMRNLIEAREMLGSEARHLQFVTLTLTPLEDTPEQLKLYKQRYGLGKDWLFLTGTPDNVEDLQTSFGYAATRLTDDRLSHATMVRICDERLMRFGHVDSMTSAKNIARMIRFTLV